ncbi:helix-turn-helix domain-containing protein [Youngiibacter multivorans]|uniref:Transcriptional regulator with XRE-family HTH domain n=1 Tax=Youngiibacter multivorans TaxID=937251 RepID=A0ABS4G326_9CLOT|nr:helix-turn-helix transcriptional regulator [Youngiibacter multivorans]MBP1918755.1 transcriptional regulator with XRE-family HTH domain [Youngiibacter multivorans]
MMIGENIQKLRKESGLSQEDLAEMLGVSRQAVSKWESDAAQPTMVNIIALAKAFDVSIGSLFGDGSENDVKGPEIDPQLVRLFTEQNEANERSARRNRTIGAVAVAVTAISMLSLYLLFSKSIDMMKAEMAAQSSRNAELNSRVDLLNSLIISQPGSIADALEDKLKTGNTNLSDYSVIVSDLNEKEGTVILKLTAFPKVHREGMAAEFIAAIPGSAPISVKGELSSGSSFTAEIRMPLSDEIRLSVVFREGTVSEPQFLEIIRDLKSQYVMKTELRFEGTSSVRNGRSSLSGQIMLKVYPAFARGEQGRKISNWPVSGKVMLYNDTTFLMEAPLPVDEAFSDLSGEITEANLYTDSIDLDVDILYGGKGLRAVAVIIDNHGNERTLEINIPYGQAN